MSTRHVFQMEIDCQLQTFIWKNTELNDSFGPAGSRKLVDEANEIVAVFSPGGGRVKKDGALHIYIDFGESFGLMTLITALVLREKSRRSANSHGTLGVVSTGPAGF